MIIHIIIMNSNLKSKSMTVTAQYELFTLPDIFQAFRARLVHDTCTREIPDKVMNLGPTCFARGRTCGHGTTYRDLIQINRHHHKTNGVTIQPKIKPTTIQLRKL